MTAVAAQITAPLTTMPAAQNALEIGAGTELFTTGLCHGEGDHLTGGGVEMFTTGLQCRETRMGQGAGTGLFTTGLSPQHA
ncbi:DUF6749 family protein [Sulfitobacter delicatus]|mgnify:FL=1|uniref:Uncharacterized protein n=1 Tax=Sulfitobacter delicatus TaxID=218672 RepID=A0A1G7QH22_9RHOB|nr:DUF6749 family protein [Sulfitobacter delicatus]SDF97857.1 hypothetical protein SAMN04489759_10467 [Sulfitobacter delicatus]